MCVSSLFYCVVVIKPSTSFCSTQRVLQGSWPEAASDRSTDPEGLHRLRDFPKTAQVETVLFYRLDVLPPNPSTITTIPVCSCRITDTENTIKGCGTLTSLWPGEEDTMCLRKLQQRKTIRRRSDEWDDICRTQLRRP